MSDHQRLLCIIVLLGLSGCVVGETLECDGKNTLFRHGYEYTYNYVGQRSSSFTGTTDSTSGTRLSCTLTVKVPVKCQLVLELSDCDGFTNDGQGNYVPFSGDENPQLFEMNSFRVQLNSGTIVPNSVFMSQNDNIIIRNVKRGIISALQLHLRNVEEYENPLEQIDIFGQCNAAYTLSASGEKKITTYRNLRKCDIRQIFRKHIGLFPGGIKRMQGGLKDAPIDEPIYPFVSEITCSHELNNVMRLRHVECLQQQYFGPLAHHGDILATAMANITQTLELVNTQRRDITDVVGVDMEKTNIMMEFLPDPDLSDPVPIAQQLITTVQAFVQDFNNFPQESLTLLNMFRKASKEALMAVMAPTFVCGAECDKMKLVSQKVYLDLLENCGTDNCIEMYLHCIGQGHTKRFQSTMFLMSLAQQKNIPDNIVIKMKEQCEASDKTSCWMALGTLVGNSNVGEDTSETSNAPSAWVVIDKLRQTAEAQCKEQQLQGTERQLINVFKALANIGYPVNKMFDEHSPESTRVLPLLEMCIRDGGISKQVTKAILMAMQTLRDKEENLLDTTKDILFELLSDVSLEMTLRSLALHLLMEDNNPATVQLILKRLDGQDTKQMKYYIQSSISALIENDQPDQKKLRETWESVLRQSSPWIPRRAHWKTIGFSKRINLAHFFKLPLTDYFGGQMLMDIVYDPAALVYQSLTISVNHYYGDTKYNLFEVSTDVHGMDQLATWFAGPEGAGFFYMFDQLKIKAAKYAQEKDLPFTNFQQNILDAVTRFIETANYPSIPNYDLVLHLKIGGQNVHFWSLSELKAAVMEMKSQAGPDNSMIANIIMNLQMGIQKSVFKVGEMIHIEKHIPTCIGVPMLLNVQAVASAFPQISLNADITTFMAELGPLTTSLSLGFNAAVFIKGELTLGNSVIRKTGIKATVNANLGLNHACNFFLYKNPASEAIPTSYKVQVDFPNFKGNEKTLASISGKLYVAHISHDEMVETLPENQGFYEKCSRPWYTALTGRKGCIHANYPDVKTSNSHPHFPLSGPFDTRLFLSKEDKSLETYTVSLQYELHNDSGVFESHLNFLHLAKGDELERRVDDHVVFNWKTRNFYADMSIPEMGVVYEGKIERKYNYEQNIRDREYTYKDVLSKDGSPMLGIIAKFHEYEEEEEGELFEKVAATLKLTMRGVSLQVQPRYAKRDDGSEKRFDIAFSYHCPQWRPVLYNLHYDVDVATANGDVSTLEIGHHQKTTPAVTDPSMSHTEVTYRASYPGQTLTLTDNRDWDLSAVHGISIFTYLDNDGTERRVRIERNGQNNTNEMSKMFNAVIAVDVYDAGHIDINVDLNGTPTSMDLTAHAEFNSYETNLSRRKRNLDSIYNRFDELSKQPSSTGDVVTDETQPENVDGSSVSSQPAEVPVVNPPSLQDLPSLPVLPSILEMNNWVADVKLSGKLVPSADGVEMIWTGDISHPWNSGYRVHTLSGKAGRNNVAHFFDFKFWAEMDESIKYTTLDGELQSPEFILGPPSFTRAVDFHASFQKLLDIGLHLNSPMVNNSLDIVLDPDNYYANFYSHLSNHMATFFNHEINDTVSMSPEQPGLIIVTSDIVHKLLQAHGTARIIPGTSIAHKASITFLCSRHGRVTRNITNDLTLDPSKGELSLSSSMISSTNPEVKLTMILMDTGEDNVRIQFAREKDGVTENLWKLVFDMWGASTLQSTLTWEPAFDEFMRSKNVFMQFGTHLMKMSDMLYENAATPWFAIRHPLLGMSFSEFMAYNIAPRLIMMERVMIYNSNNFIRTESRKLASMPLRLQRVKTALAEKLAAKPEGISLMLSRMVKLRAYFTKRVGQLAMVVGGKMIHKRAKLYEKRELVAAVPIPFVYNRIQSAGLFIFHFRPRDSMFQLLPFISLPIRRARAKSLSKSFLYVPKPVIGAMFGGRSQDSPVNLVSFNGDELEIPASNAGLCSYLLVAHVSNRDYAVVSTPTGISFITKSFTASIQQDGHIFKDNCKVPVESTSSPSGDVTVEVQGDKVVINTQYGISVSCLKGIEGRVCSFMLDPGQRNQTLGLLGTNTVDTITDMRKLDGSFASTKSDLLSEYVVSGPESCSNHPPQPTLEDVCNDNVHSYCFKYFKVYDSPIVRNCRALVSNVPYMDVCRRVSQKCGSDEADICQAVYAYEHICKLAGGNFSDTMDNPAAVPCFNSAPQVEHADHGVGSLDVVFVVSQHKSMSVTNRKPWKMIYDLLHTPADMPFESVRIGVVGFAGKQDAGTPYVLHQNGGYFADQQDIDLSSLKLVTDGDTPADPFRAMELAMTFPFNPTSHKIMIVLTTKDQIVTDNGDIDNLLNQLRSQSVTVNLFSTYSKLASRKVVGVDWQNNVLTNREDLDKVINLPVTNYLKVVTATKGATIDLLSLTRSRHMTRILQHFVDQTRQDNTDTCSNM